MNSQSRFVWQGVQKNNRIEPAVENICGKHCISGIGAGNVHRCRINKSTTEGIRPAASIGNKYRIDFCCITTQRKQTDTTDKRFSDNNRSSKSYVDDISLTTTFGSAGILQYNIVSRLSILNRAACNRWGAGYILGE